MDRYIGLDAHASSCTLAVVGPSGKRLGSHVVETNARALIEVLRGIPKSRHMCLEEGTLTGWLHEVLEPHVEELVVTGVGKSRGPKSDKRDAFGLAEQLRIGAIKTRVYKGRGQFMRLGNLAKAYGFLVGDTVRVKNRLRSVLRSRGVGYGAGQSVYAKREREQWLGKLPEATMAQAGLLYEEHDALVALRRKAEKAMLAEARKHRELARADDVPGSGPDPDRRITAGCGDTVPVQKPERILGVLRPGHRDAELVGLGASLDGGVDEDAGAADSGPEPQLQPHAEACVQGSGDDGDRTGRGGAPVPALPEPVGRWHEAQPGEADHRASDRLDCAGAMAHGRGVRPDETGSDGVKGSGIGERGVEGCVDEDGSDEPEANRLQGRASIEMLGWAEWPESPGIGYAPLESRTKRWAIEPQIEGWFPLLSGECHGCEGLSDCDTEPMSAPTLSRRTGNPNYADACGKKMSRRRVADLSLDLWPHRRHFKGPCPSAVPCSSEARRVRNFPLPKRRQSKVYAHPPPMQGRDEGMRGWARDAERTRLRVRLPRKLGP